MWLVFHLTQDIMAENAEGSGTLFKGLTSFVESNISKDSLDKMSIDSLKATFKLPDNAFTRRLERGMDSIVAKVEGGMSIWFHTIFYLLVANHHFMPKSSKLLRPYLLPYFDHATDITDIDLNEHPRIRSEWYLSNVRIHIHHFSQCTSAHNERKCQLTVCRLAILRLFISWIRFPIIEIFLIWMELSMWCCNI